MIENRQRSDRIVTNSQNSINHTSSYYYPADNMPIESSRREISDL